MPKNVSLHYLLLIQKWADTSTSYQINLFNFWDKYGRELRCPNF